MGENNGKKISEEIPLTQASENGIEFINTDKSDIIELKNICQVYNNGSSKSVVIDGLNLLIEDKPDQGQFFVLLGKSGCGKSTVLRYICGLQDPTSGEVLINGTPRSDKHPISMVFQQYSSLPWFTVLKNIMLPLEIKGVSRSECKERAMEMIRLVGLDGHEHKFAQYPLLSGGQLQRLAIARSLISNPRIILMDEPFGALDAHTRASMQLLLKDIWARLQSTIIFVTHEIREAIFLGDDIFIMSSNPGRITNYIHVDLPLDRDRSIRSNQRFVELEDVVERLLLET